MDKKELIKAILKKQGRPHKLPGTSYIPVSIRLKNGNILLKEFRIISLERNTIVGLTRQEEYSAPRENREPVFCKLDLNEIDSIEWYGLEVVEIAS